MPCPATPSCRPHGACCLPPGTPAGTGTAVIQVAQTPGAHKASVDAIALSRNGKHVVSGGNDKLIKVWPEKGVRAGGRGGPPSNKHWPSPCQPYAGHSDHVTRLVFSSDGATLISVGGGDAIYLWEFKGPPGVDEMEMVEESLRQAEAERGERLAQRAAEEERLGDAFPTPSQVMQAGMRAAEKAEMMGSPANVEALRERLEKIHTAEAGYMMAGVEAAMRASAKAKGVDLEDVEEEAEEEAEPEAEEEAAEEEEVTGSMYSPRKKFVARVVYSDEGGEDGADEIAAALEAEAEEAAAEPTSPGSLGLAGGCAKGLQLRRIIGLSTHAHDHVHWEPSMGVLIYATGDTLVVDRLASTDAPASLTGGSGEIATLALCLDGRFAAVGSGGDAPICVYDLAGRHEDASEDVDDVMTLLRMRLPGHVGGVQSLAFLGNAALASLGLSDGALRVHSIVSGAPLLSCTTPVGMHCLAVSADGMEISTAGKGGLFTWRVSTQSTAAGTRAVLMPMPTREQPPLEGAEEGEETAQATCLVHLSAALTLVGDSAVSSTCGRRRV